MHESGVMRDILQKVDEISRAEGGSKKIVGLKVWCGALSQMTPDHFKEHFDIEAKGSPAASAQLDITIDSDMSHPRAQEIVLESIEVEA